MNISSCRNRKAAQFRSAHRTINLSAAESSILLPAITDYASIQLALSTVIHAIAEGALDVARAKVLLSGLQIASANLRRLETSAKGGHTARKPAPAKREASTAHVESEPVQEDEAIADKATLQAITAEAPSSGIVTTEDAPIRADGNESQPHEPWESAEDISPKPRAAISPAVFSDRHGYINEASLRLRAHLQRRE